MFWLLLMGALSAPLAGYGQAPPNVSPEIRHWYEPAEPLRIAGPIYSVGTKGLCVYLIATPAGHLLIDGGMPESAGLIEASIRKLGFRVEDIRWLLTTQAHIDHVGTMAALKKSSGARVAAMGPDAELLANGGRTDFLFADRSFFHFPPVEVERVLRDNDTIELGGITLRALHTPGHTQGCTTFTTTIEENGTKYFVVFPGSLARNPGTRLLRRPSYPGIFEDYRKAFAKLEALQPDIFLQAHAEAFGFEEKRARATSEGARAFVDPAGYRAWLANQKASFEADLAKERAARPASDNGKAPWSSPKKN